MISVAESKSLCSNCKVAYIFSQILEYFDTEFGSRRLVFVLLAILSYYYLSMTWNSLFCTTSRIDKKYPSQNLNISYADTKGLRKISYGQSFFSTNSANDDTCKKENSLELEYVRGLVHHVSCGAGSTHNSRWEPPGRRGHAARGWDAVRLGRESEARREGARVWNKVIK